MTCVVNGAPTVKECELQFYSATIFIKKHARLCINSYNLPKYYFTWFPVLGR